MKIRRVTLEIEVPFECKAVSTLVLSSGSLNEAGIRNQVRIVRDVTSLSEELPELQPEIIGKNSSINELDNQKVEDLVMLFSMLRKEYEKFRMDSHVMESPIMFHARKIEEDLVQRGYKVTRS